MRDNDKDLNTPLSSSIERISTRHPSTPSYLLSATFTCKTGFYSLSYLLKEFNL